VPPEGQWPETDFRRAVHRYFETMAIPLRRGRTFTEADRDGAPPVAVVNESFAKKFFGAEDPIGRQVRLGPSSPIRQATIVGIVGDVQQYALDQAPTPQSYIPQAQDLAYGYSLFVRTMRDRASFERELRDVFRSVDKTQPLPSVVPLEAYLKASLAQRRFTLLLLGGFGALGLLMAAVGTYGVVSYAATLRTREVGIRMALGALPRDVLAMVLRQGLVLAAAGLALGSLAALALTRVLSGLLFEVDPLDPAAAASVAALLAAVVAVASWLPARRATRVDPLAALRCD
jgi:putative ABC transport system permease protein